MVDTPSTPNILSLSHLDLHWEGDMVAWLWDVRGWLHVTWDLILLLKSPLTCLRRHRLHLLPVDKVLILVTLHLILNGSLQVPNAFERQL